MVVEMLSKIQSDPSPLGYRRFFKKKFDGFLKKYSPDFKGTFL